MTYTGVKMPTAAEAAPAKPATRALEFGARHRTLRRRARADHGRWKFLHRIQAAELRPQVQRAGRVPLVVRGRNVAMPGRADGVDSLMIAFWTWAERPHVLSGRD